MDAQQPGNDIYGIQGLHMLQHIGVNKSIFYLSEGAQFSVS